MATYDELFGNKNSGPKRPQSPKWNEVGDVFVGVISGEPELVDNRFGGKQNYMVKTEEGWKKKLEGEFDTGLDHFKIVDIAIPVTGQDGNPYTMFFGRNDDSLKDAMQDSGLPLAEGVTIAKKFIRLKGKQKVYAVKLAKAE